MFKKRVEFKGSAVVGGKDMKKLKKDAASSMGIRCVPVGRWRLVRYILRASVCTPPPRTGVAAKSSLTPAVGSEDAAAALFPHKVEISVKKVAQGGSKMQVYFAGDQPIIVDEGRGKLFPTGTCCTP